MIIFTAKAQRTQSYFSNRHPRQAERVRGSGLPDEALTQSGCPHKAGMTGAPSERNS